MKRLLLLTLLFSLSTHANVTELKTSAQVKVELAKPGRFVVLYYTSWCPACAAYKPYYEKESDRFPHVRFYKMNVDKITIKEHKYKVPYIPMLFSGKNEAEFRNNPCIAQDDERVDLAAFFLRCTKL